MTFHHLTFRARRRVLPALTVLLLTAACLAGGCGSSGKRATTNSAVSSPVNQVEQVRRTWEAFFDGSTSPATKVGLLQHGQAFAPLIQGEAALPLAKQTKVLVQSVRLVGNSRAIVRYTITIAGRPALPNQTGTAVLSGGKWQVSDGSFCALLALQGVKPPACRRV